MIYESTISNKKFEAMQFHYDRFSIDNLKKFCGEAFKNGGKNRHPSAIGWIEIRNLNEESSFRIEEGSWILKHEDGYLSPCTDANFKTLFKPV